MKNWLKLFFIAFVSVATAQEKNYTAEQAHAHNDYEQLQPFQLAYQEQFGSMEADIHLYAGQLFVAHDNKEIKPARTLQKLYLDPINTHISKITKLQLLIDIKTDAISTLEALIKLLQTYPEIIQSNRIRLVISGNRPPATQWITYPSYIQFDGRLETEYTTEQLSKVALLSESYFKFVKPSSPWPLHENDRQRLKQVIQQGQQLGKPVRLWAHPDFPEAWEEMMRLGLDYINTDKIIALSDFLTSRNKQTRLLPYNRIIQSAGEVIRYGKPDLENHALDVTPIPSSALVAVMERYGIFVIDPQSKKTIAGYRFTEMPPHTRFMSTYSGIKSFIANDKTYIVWGAAERDGGKAALMVAEWNNGLSGITDFPIARDTPADNAIPNDIAVVQTKGKTSLYIALNGNNKLIKFDWNTKKTEWSAATGVAPFGVAKAGNKIFVSNWAGAIPTDTSKERAGVPWGLAYTDPRTGATASGTLSVFDETDGRFIREIEVGLHPNAIISSKDEKYIYVANGSSDAISVVNTHSLIVSETIPVGIQRSSLDLQGSTPNGLALNASGDILYVSNGLDNAVVHVALSKKSGGRVNGSSTIKGRIPTEAYPAGLLVKDEQLIVANLESDGANVIDARKKARSIHHELASVSIIAIPSAEKLQEYTGLVAQYNALNRIDLLALKPRPHMQPVPVPERLGEPSVFKHVVYIIKENKTYDQVFGDMEDGDGDSSLCVFGMKTTPNTHALAKQFGLMDNYHASGKSSAEGHQWTDAGMVSDYVEKNVRAWFRSYPHRQTDALVYNKSGFIWNHALDHGKSVRVFGEACETMYDTKLQWKELYEQYKGGIKPNWYNASTIARLRPIISTTFPDCDNMVFSDQQRADIFMQEWKQYEQGDSLPNLMILSLPNDHTAGTSPEFPTPDAMVADNDLALGRIVDMISKSKYWDSTVIFITQDDSQSGWDHVSAYRTVGLVVSPYSAGKLINTHFNQVSMLRTMEQILGIPPMNIMDATSRLMTDCFNTTKKSQVFNYLPNHIPLDKMNKPLQALSGKERKFAEISQREIFREVDGGEDDRMNRVIWHYTKGDVPYPGKK
jgi:YVTN family beta-propeller protein